MFEPRDKALRFEVWGKVSMMLGALCRTERDAGVLLDLLDLVLKSSCPSEY